MRIAALGRTRMLWNTIQTLCASEHEVVLIATCRGAPEYDVREHDFERLAKNLNVPFLCTQNLNRPDMVEQLRAAQADIAVSVNWVNRLGPEACGAFREGILNAHAGDLPRYRGNAPVAWAMLQGERRIGITIHMMDPYEIDAGPIVLKDYYALDEDTYIGQIFQFLDERIPFLFLQSINGLAAGTLERLAQSKDSAFSLRCYPRRPEDGWIDWKQPADRLARLVRASSEPFAGAFTFFQSKRLTIWRAHAVQWPCPSLAIPGQVTQRDTMQGHVTVATGDHLLVLDEVELDNQGRCRPVSIIKSLRDRLGMHHALRGHRRA